MMNAKISDGVLGWTKALGLVCCLAGPALLGEALHATPHKLALLVGIDQYRYHGIPDLEGSVNDVVLMKNLLVERFGFPDDPDHIRVLTNGEATRQRILDSIEQHLIAQATRDSIVVFHFSGHGSQTAELAGVIGDEDDGLDETLLPVDSGREPHPNRDIRDDELHSLLTRLAAKASQVTVVLDSCHSGTATRGGGRARSVPADRRNMERDDRTREAAQPSRAVDRGWPRDGAYALVAGAADEEKAYEVVEGSKTYGALTWHLNQAIRAAGEDATYGEVMETVKARVTGRFPGQHPQFEGRGPGALVFGEPSHGERATISVVESVGGGLELQAGQAHGVTRGSTYEVFAASPGGRESTARSLARFEVVDVGTTSAALRLLSGSMAGGTLQAIETLHRPAERKIRVYLEQAETTPVLTKLARRLVAYSHLELVDGDRGYDLLLRRQGDQILTEGATPDEISPPVEIAQPDAVERLQRQVLVWVRWMQILTIESRHASLKVDFEVEIQLTRGNTGLAHREADLIIAPKDRFTLKVGNRSEFPLYFTLLDLTSSGAVHLITPRSESGQATRPIAPGKVWTETVEANLPDGVESVRHVLKLLTTAQPADFTFLSSPPDVGSDIDRLVERVAVEAERTLARAAFGVPRGEGSGGTEPQPWATHERILEIRRAKP